MEEEELSTLRSTKSTARDEAKGRPLTLGEPFSFMHFSTPALTSASCPRGGQRADSSSGGLERVERVGNGLDLLGGLSFFPQLLGIR